MTLVPRRAIPAFVLCLPILACAANSPTAPSSHSANDTHNATTGKPIVDITSLIVAPCPTTTITPGTTAQLAANVNLADGTSQDVTAQSLWVSASRNVASVGTDGLVTALIPGLTIVTANFQGVKRGCQFLVDGKPPPPSLPPSSGDGIVINEFRARGPNGGDDEFIELRNASTGAISVGGWHLGQSSKSGTATETLVTLPAGLVISPGCYFLVTRSVRQVDPHTPRSGTPTNTPAETSVVYSGLVPGDANFYANLFDEGGLAVFRPDGTAVDAVGMSLGTIFKEGVPLLSFGTNNQDRSYQRANDSDNNVADFLMSSPSTPTNRAGACEVPQ